MPTCAVLREIVNGYLEGILILDNVIARFRK